ncbi:unnamed protein product [Rotaria sordida]|uniref:Histone acetyltransferase n=1 Tax=Rotaria sordida TaxID=392033 RepID=A0A814MPS2_9BILA|nr:unnamed protein product [Rotaria sordida]CAF1272823.1 unnamed protein product [Rotaria sordida]
MADDDLMSDDEQLDVPNNIKHITSIRLGQVDIDCWFDSPYINVEDGSNEKDRSIEKLYICEYCLRYFLNNRKYRQHMNECNRRYPPGRKIYEHPDGLSVYEVDGTTSQLYCQCLCLLAKLFLERKTIYFDVNPFLFYVLVESDKRIKNVQHIIGYFSKEKLSDEFYNLACLMVLPHRQRQGFGRFLIALSYELTKLEKKTGSPEKPLSALGQMTYKSYWHSTILSKLDEYHRLQIHVTVTELSMETGICIEDVVQTLIDLRLAHTKNSTNEINFKQPEVRNRRRHHHHHQCDNNLDVSSVLIIDVDALRTALNNLSTSNLSSKHNQNAFDSTYLRLISRR